MLLSLAGGRCLSLGAGLRRRRFGLDPLPRLARPTLLLFANQLAELCLGVGLGLLQFLGLGLGRLLSVGDLVGLVGSRPPLLLERLLLLGELTDRLLEIVGVGRARVQGDAGQFVALEFDAELRRLAEDPHSGRAGVEVGLHGDVAELGLKFGDLGLFLGDGLLGGGHVVLQLTQFVEGDVVLFGESSRLLLHRFEHVGVLLDLAALVVDRVCRNDTGTGQGRDEDGDSGEHGARETGAERSHDAPHPSQTLRTHCNHVAEKPRDYDELLPLDRAGGLAGDVVDDPVDPGDLVDDAVGDPFQQVGGKPGPVGRHRIVTCHGSDDDRMTVRALVTHHPDRADVGGEDGEALPDVALQAGGDDLAAHDGIGLLQHGDPLTCHLAEDPHRQARPGERLPPHHRLGQAELESETAHLVLEQSHATARRARGACRRGVHRRCDGS